MKNLVTGTAGLEMSDLFENPALRAYLDNVRAWHGYVRFLGLPDRRDNPDVIIDRLFVWPRLTRRHVSPDEAPASWSDEAESVLDALTIGKPLILLGDPGSGKSTLLNYLVWLLARPSENPLIERLGWRLPVPMVLRELRLHGVTDFEGLLRAFLDHAMSKPLRERGYLHEMLEADRAFLLLDGIDEIGDLKMREDLRRAVFDGFARYPGCRWVLSSRIVGYDEAPFNEEFSHKTADPSASESAMPERIGGFSKTARLLSSRGETPPVRALHGAFVAGRGIGDISIVTRFIAPFDDKRIASFARKWYAQREAAATRAGEDASHLVRAVHADESILRLARVPNLLTMMALIHRIETTLPHGRALLYDRIAEAYLESIDRFRGLYSGAHDLPRKKLWLARVGYEMQRRRVSKEEVGGLELLVESGDVTMWLEEAMKGGGAATGVGSPKEFLDFAGRRSGLFLPRGEGRYAFIHLSFQEYFASVALEREVTGIGWAKGERSPLGLDRNTLADWAQDGVWRETIVFLFELLAPKEDWHTDLLDSIFGKDFSKLNTSKPDTGILNLACLAARLALNPRSGLDLSKRELIVDGCIRVQFEYQSNSNNRFLRNIVLRELFDDDAKWNAGVLKTIGRLLESSVPYRLNLSGTKVSDIAPLADLRELEWLDLDGTRVSDLTPIANLASLEWLSLDGTKFSDLTPIANLASLKRLSLEGTEVSDLAPLENLAALEWLDLDGTRVSDLTPIANLTTLELLSLEGTEVSDLTPLENLAALEWLDLDGTRVSDLTPIANLTTLKQLYLSGAETSEIKVDKLRKMLPDCTIISG